MPSKRYHLNESNLWLEVNLDQRPHMFKVYLTKDSFAEIFSGLKNKGERLHIHKKTLGANESQIRAVEKALDFILEKYDNT